MSVTSLILHVLSIKYNSQIKQDFFLFEHKRDITGV